MAGTIYKPKARLDAFLVLYQWEMRGEDISSLTEEYIQQKGIDYSEHRRYIRKLVKTFFEHAKEVDKIISEHLEGWDLDRLGYIERNILRLAVTEFLYIGVKKPKQVLSDYLKMSIKYAGSKPTRFINGVLAKILKERVGNLQ